MEHTTNRTFICSVVFLDIVSYSELPVDEQIRLKSRFNIILAEAIKDVAVNDRIILDTGDGAAISFLGDPEDALFVALSIRDAIIGDKCSSPPCLSARIGINMGPVKLVQDINGQRNLIGDGINVAQRVMSFANPEQVLVSRSYFEVISRLSQEYAKLFHYEGSRADKHVREHQVYSVSPAEKEQVPPPAPPVQQKEEGSKEIPRGAASTATSQTDAGGQSGKTVTAGEGQPFPAPKKNSRHFDWKKMLDSWSAKGRDRIKTLNSWSAKGRDRIKTLISSSVKGFNWNQIRNNRTMLYGAAALIVILISVPVIIWTMRGATAKDPQTIPSPTTVATPEVAKEAGPSVQVKELPQQAPTTVPEEQKKSEPPTTIETPATPAVISFGVAPWGEVYVDGSKKGVSPPLNTLKVAPGQHLIEIRNTSFPSYKQTVDLKPGEQFKIRHKFLK